MNGRLVPDTAAMFLACCVQLIETPLPKLPREAGVAIHWLAINGVQPELPENTPVEQPPAKRQKKAAATAQKPAGQDAVAAGAGMPGRRRIHVTYRCHVNMVLAFILQYGSDTRCSPC